MTDSVIGGGNSGSLAVDVSKPEATPTPPPPPPAGYTASIFPGERGFVPPDFAEGVLMLEKSLGLPVWILVHGFDDGPLSMINEEIRLSFFDKRDELRGCEGAALLLDSPGGIAGSAYQIATLFRRHCGPFTVIVPRMAKSAATLLTLGGDRIYLGEDAELGPLDVQLWDSDRETYASALDEVQALERLNAVALDFVDQAMWFLTPRTGKKTVELLPLVLNFATEFMHPLLDKIDTVHYNERARVLKVAEEYAVRLLRPNYPRPRRGGLEDDQGERIARSLVNSYPEHGFVINRDEARELLSRTLLDADTETQTKIDDLERMLTEAPMTAIGRIERRDGSNGAGSPRDDA